MKRHVIDQSRPEPTGARVKNFVAIDRRTGEAHPATKALLRKPASRPAKGARTAQYARIERGRTA